MHTLFNVTNHAVCTNHVNGRCLAPALPKYSPVPRLSAICGMNDASGERAKCCQAGGGPSIVGAYSGNESRIGSQ